MPLSIKDIQEKTSTVTINYYGDTADVIYYVSKITEEMFIEAVELSDDADDNVDAVIANFDALNMFLAQVVKEWEIEESPGKMFPLRDKDGGPSKRLRELPLPLKTLIRDAIVEDYQGKGAASGRRSRRGSLRRRK